MQPFLCPCCFSASIILVHAEPGNKSTAQRKKTLSFTNRKQRRNDGHFAIARRVRIQPVSPNMIAQQQPTATTAMIDEPGRGS